MLAKLLGLARYKPGAEQDADCMKRRPGMLVYLLVAKEPDLRKVVLDLWAVMNEAAAAEEYWPETTAVNERSLVNFKTVRIRRYPPTTASCTFLP